MRDNFFMRQKKNYETAKNFMRHTHFLGDSKFFYKTANNFIRQQI